MRDNLPNERRLQSHLDEAVRAELQAFDLFLAVSVKSERVHVHVCGQGVDVVAGFSHVLHKIRRQLEA